MVIVWISLQEEMVEISNKYDCSAITEDNESFEFHTPYFGVPLLEPDTLSPQPKSISIKYTCNTYVFRVLRE